MAESRWSLDLGVKGDPVVIRDVDGMVFPALGGLHVPELPVPIYRYSASRGRVPAITRAAISTMPMAGISAIHGEPVVWPSRIAAVKAFSLIVITDPSAPSHWLNAQSDWPGPVPISKARG
jgi:hypothetical protein